MGRVTKFIFGATASMLLGGCTVVANEFRHPGGFPGRQLDKRTFDASESKQLQLLRFSIIMVMAARMSGESVDDSKSADAVAEYLAATADEINFAAVNVYGAPCTVGTIPTINQPNPSEIEAIKAELKSTIRRVDAAAMQAEAAAKAAQIAEAAARAVAAGLPVPPLPAPQPVVGINCSGSYVSFEAEVPLIHRRLLNLMLATLPRDRIREFVEDISTGNFLAGAWSAALAFRDAAGGLHVAAGSYRTGQEVLVANFGNYPCAPGAERRAEAEMTVKHAVACLGLDAEQLFGPHKNELKEDQLPPNISDDSFHTLFRLARTSCVRMPFGDPELADLNALKDAAKRRNELCGRVQWNPKLRPDIINIQ